MSKNPAKFQPSPSSFSTPLLLILIYICKLSSSVSKSVTYIFNVLHWTPASTDMYLLDVSFFTAFNDLISSFSLTIVSVCLLIYWFKTAILAFLSLAFKLIIWLSWNFIILSCPRHWLSASVSSFRFISCLGKRKSAFK